MNQQKDVDMGVIPRRSCAHANFANGSEAAPLAAVLIVFVGKVAGEPLGELHEGVGECGAATLPDERLSEIASLLVGKATRGSLLRWHHGFFDGHNAIKIGDQATGNHARVCHSPRSAGYAGRP
jgi:hypothetical protein